MDSLIVSSDDKIIQFLSEQLKACGLGVLLAGTNKLAVKQIKSKKPWLVFAEIDGEDISALPLLRDIENDCPEVSVIGIAKSFDANEALSLLRRGVRDYLAFPLPDDENLIEDTVRRARARAEGIVNYMDAHDELEAEHDSVGRELRQLQEDQEAGRYVQLKIFPKNPFNHAGMSFCHRIFPSLYLSGDFIDYFPLDKDRVFFYFADVSGHGASSAFVTVMLKTISHRWVQDLKSKSMPILPVQYISYINQELLKMKLGKHMTLFCGLLDTQHQAFLYSSAAHFPKPRYRNNGEMHELSENSMPVGVFEGAEYPEGEISLSDDFCLYLFSDGVMEVIDVESMQEKESALNTLIDENTGHLDDLCQELNLDKKVSLPDDIGVLQVCKQAT